MLPGGRRQLRILVSAPGQVRVHLTADLLRRAAEAARLLPMVTELLPAEAPGPSAAMLRAAWNALNIHPPQDTMTAPVDPLAGMPLFDVGIGLAGEASNSDVTDLARLWVQVVASNQEAEPGRSHWPSGWRCCGTGTGSRSRRRRGTGHGHRDARPLAGVHRAVGAVAQRGDVASARGRGGGRAWRRP